MSGIWIRTQDKKRLVYCKDIETLGDTVISNYDKEDYFKLGKYETGGRAIEVLDDIQEHIETRVVSDWLMVDMFKLPVDTYTHEEYKDKLKKLSCVYEMPKE